MADEKNSFEIKGVDQVVRNLSNYKANVIKEIVAGATAVQQNVVNMAQGVLRPGYGYVYGNLKRSIMPGPVIIEDDNVTAFVVANAPYAEYVEFGTRRNQPKPYLGPALLQNIRTFEKAMAAAAQRAKAAP